MQVATTDSVQRSGVRKTGVMQILRRGDVLACLAVAAVFLLFPQLDLVVSGRFHNEVEGWYLGDNPVVLAVYHGAELVAWIIGLTLLIVYGLGHLWPRLLPAGWRAVAAFVLLSTLIGPMLVINAGFKEHWGRAKPNDVAAFGGERAYSGALRPAAQCASNCSFPSGHATVGYAFLAFALVLPRRRRFWLAAGTGLGLAIGAVRVVQGGHFVSDVLFSGFMVWFCALGARHLRDNLTMEWLRAVPARVRAARRLRPARSAS